MSTHARETHTFQAEVNQLLGLVVNSLYSNKDIFLRELISNASDALDRLKFQAITEKSLIEDGTALRIRVLTDAEAGTLTIDDTGSGMTKDELIKHLGTIAHSGTRSFVERATAAAGDQPTAIGQFGVGFYSAFLVADHVEVISRSVTSAGEAWRWLSDAKGDFTVEPAERAERGTAVILHLKESERHYLDRFELKDLIRRWSDYVSHPIEMAKVAPSSADTAADKTQEAPGFEQVNQARALWQRPKSEVTDEQYEEFYKHVSHDFESPLARTHFKIEGNQLFTGLLFIPRRPPFDLFMQKRRQGVRLYVKRVFIMDDCDALVPDWLRFLRGVIDSDDLPLNVSREILQDSSLTRTIKKQIAKKTLDLLDEVAEHKPEDYETLWKAYGAVLKEGFHFEPEYKSRLAKLARWDSSRGEGLTSLAKYVARMPEGQKDIYFLTAESRAVLERSPHLESLRKKGYEVLFMTDPIDEWVAPTLQEFEGKPLVSAASASLSLDGELGADEKLTASKERYRDLIAAMQAVLASEVSEVRVSARLTDSPCCLVVPEGGMSAHIERLLRHHEKDMPKSKRILEINPEHAVVARLETHQVRHGSDDRFTAWVETLFDQALLAEGSPVPDAGRLARRVAELLDQALTHAVAQ